MILVLRLERCREAIDILGSYIELKESVIYNELFYERRLSMTRNSPITGLDIQYVTRIRELIQRVLVSQRLHAEIS